MAECILEGGAELSFRPIPIFISLDLITQKVNEDILMKFPAFRVHDFLAHPTRFSGIDFTAWYWSGSLRRNSFQDSFLQNMGLRTRLVRLLLPYIGSLAKLDENVTQATTSCKDEQPLHVLA
jgi:hypothetical protein